MNIWKNNPKLKKLTWEWRWLSAQQKVIGFIRWLPNCWKIIPGIPLLLLVMLEAIIERLTEVGIPTFQNAPTVLLPVGKGRLEKILARKDEMLALSRKILDEDKALAKIVENGSLTNGDL